MLVVDQFEELWTTCADPGSDAVPRHGRRPGRRPPVSRAGDPLGLPHELADHEALAALVGDGAVLVGAPREAEVRRAVAVAGAALRAELETGLLDAVVDDAGREPGVLPLLSTAMARLWEHRAGAR